MVEEKLTYKKVNLKFIENERKNTNYKLFFFNCKSINLYKKKIKKSFSIFALPPNILQSTMQLSPFVYFVKKYF